MLQIAQGKLAIFASFPGFLLLMFKVHDAAGANSIQSGQTPVLATSDICSGNGPVLHDGESRLAIAVLTGKNIRWPKGQFPLPDPPFPVARNSMERQRGYLGWPHFGGVGELGSSSAIALFIDDRAKIVQR